MNENDYIGADETARILKIQLNTLYSLVNSRKISYYKPYRKLLFLRSEIEKIIKESRVASDEENEKKAIDNILASKEN